MSTTTAEMITFATYTGTLHIESRLAAPDADPIETYSNDEFAANIWRHADWQTADRAEVDQEMTFGTNDPITEETCVLHWTDYVANDWAEILPTARLASLRLQELIDVVAREDGLSDINEFVAKNRDK